jgi:hypothetical protein
MGVLIFGLAIAADTQNSLPSGSASVTHPLPSDRR